MTFAFYIKIQEKKTNMEEKIAVRPHISHPHWKTMAFFPANNDLGDPVKSCLTFLTFSTSVFLTEWGWGGDEKA